MSGRSDLLRRASWVLCMIGIVAAGGSCQGPERTSPSVGSNSNWLRACSTDADCDAPLSCECGACTSICSEDVDCEAVDEARCARSSEPAVWATCQSTMPSDTSGLCLPTCEPGTCAPAQACVSEACVLTSLPDNPFCNAVADASNSSRRREDEVLSLINTTRQNGGFTCGGSALVAAPPLRLDTRLLCAARAFAADVQRTRSTSLIDSEGRSTVDRLALAGYEPALWGESFALSADSASRTLEFMSEDVDTCRRMADPQFTDIGVGSSGDVEIVIVAVQ